MLPQGTGDYIGDCYGGSTSDRQLVERSSLIGPDVLQPGDSILADRGFAVQDLLALRGVTVNKPNFLKGKSQLEPEEIVSDRRIASKRIHIERVIGLGKTYKILRKELQHQKLQMGNMIVYVCYMLSNFRSSIVNRMS